MTQLLLFEGLAHSTIGISGFKTGDIVRQSWPWIGMYDRIFPYWQVRVVKTNLDQMLDSIRSEHPKWSEDHVQTEGMKRTSVASEPNRLNYLCAAVPYGGHPGEVNWFHEDDLLPTRLHWAKIPTQAETNDWCRRKYATNEFLVGLNKATRLDDGRWSMDASLDAYAEETELVRMLQTLPVKWNEVTRENFDVLFPDCSGLPLTALPDTDRPKELESSLFEVPTDPSCRRPGNSASDVRKGKA